MPCYETIFVTRPDMSQQEVEKLTLEFSAIITDLKGKTVKTENWGLRSLAYKINKNSKGHYVMLCIDAPVEAIDELNRNLRINESIVRTMTVKVETFDDKPSPMMRSSYDDEDEEKAEDAA